MPAQRSGLIERGLWVCVGVLAFQLAKLLQADGILGVAALLLLVGAGVMGFIDRKRDTLKAKNIERVIDARVPSMACLALSGLIAGLRFRAALGTWRWALFAMSGLFACWGCILVIQSLRENAKISVNANEGI